MPTYLGVDDFNHSHFPSLLPPMCQVRGHLQALMRVRDMNQNKSEEALLQWLD
ncbi:unnamed protein product [Spirodela intermedia]|uniref:Uncharacterized protein n=2 Tax=Spirodela intermedia TaxID=51605 RepID=A0A7I8L4K7_SPIIN|nr:unnamed protein product [Spirodela intermedia]CAA6668101.1 unnamed protein product [Spirodela intermedia]CAA7404931.1 unnamed protein product [Spirodela intermedia]